MAKTKDATIPKSNNAFVNIVGVLNKKYGNNVMLDPNRPYTYADTAIPTSSTALNLILGGGFQIGRLYELYGPEGSGKTTTLIDAAIGAQHRYPDKGVVFIDTEYSFDKDYAEHLGLDTSPDKFQLVGDLENSIHGDGLLEIARQFARSKTTSLILLDTLAALLPALSADKEVGETSMGDQARLLSDFYRKFTAALSGSGSSFIAANQIRYKIGGYGDPETTPGGEASKFYSHVRLRLQGVNKWKSPKDATEFIGHDLQVKVVKNKVNGIKRKFHIPLLFGDGFQRPLEVLRIASKMGLVKKAGSWFSYADNKLGQGEQTVANILAKDPELLETIEATIMDNPEDALDAIRVK